MGDMADKQRLRVDLGARAYDILVGAGLLATAGETIAPLLGNKSVRIVTDSNVAPHYLSALEVSFARQNIDFCSYVLPPGEETKSFATLEKLCDDILGSRIERSTTLIALGGGVIGDLTGFAAAILLRGVPFIQIPTSLLAQVDSSVGGKTGISTAKGKNLVGAFHQPQLVLIDTESLRTLPARELRAGYAEVVKYGLIEDADFFAWLESKGAGILAGDPDLLREAIVTSCRTKAKIVAEDERERGRRALLNLGHTFGHALEAETGYSSELLHGEAVAIGSVMAFAFSARQGLCPQEDLTRVRAHLQASGLPTDLSTLRDRNWHRDALLAHMGRDKKVSGGKLTFILARGIGKAFVTSDVDSDALCEFLEETLRG